MNNPKVDYRIEFPETISPSRGYITNSVLISINSRSEEILEIQTTGNQTLRSTPFHPPILEIINLRSSSHGHIYHLLSNRLVNHRWLCRVLASKISAAANLSGFGRKTFSLSVFVNITYQTNSRALLLRKGTEESKSLKIEAESCSICLDDLTGSLSKHGVPTHTTCSHVFHYRCLSEWFHRKHTCPLCRTVL